MQCNSKFKNTKLCKTPNLDENQLKNIFMTVFNNTLANRHDIISSIITTIDEVTDVSKLEIQIESKRSKLQLLGITLKECIENNMHYTLNQDDYDAKFKVLENEYDNLKIEIAKLENLKATTFAKRKELHSYIRTLKSNNHIIAEFDESLFHGLVESITANTDNTLVFKYKDDSEIIWDIKNNTTIS